MIVNNCDFIKNSLPDKCANLIIADPPYFEVKGSFDFIWSSFDQYLADVEKWAVECKRLLADNGTLLWYGDSKKIAYSQIILDKYFELVSNVTVHVYDRQTNKIKIEDARGFINTSERVLMYAAGVNDMDGLISRSYFSKYLKSEFEKANISNSEIAKLFPSKTGGLTGCVRNWLSGANIITEDQYLTIRAYLNRLLPSNIYLLKDYKDLKRPFNPIEQYKMDVLRFSQEAHITSRYNHDTVKPEKLTRMFIRTCSRVNDLVVVPFAGSGTECAMALKEGRYAIGFDVEPKYVDIANRRCESILSMPVLL